MRASWRYEGMRSRSALSHLCGPYVRSGRGDLGCEWGEIGLTGRLYEVGWVFGSEHMPVGVSFT